MQCTWTACGQCDISKQPCEHYMTHTEQGRSVLCVRWTVMWIFYPVFNLHCLCSVMSCVIVNNVQLNWHLFGLTSWKGIEFCHHECCRIHVVCKLAKLHWWCLCIFSQSWKTVCQSWQPFWNTRLWILQALRHHARYRRIYQKHQLIFQWGCMNHLNHQILFGKIYTPYHCRFFMICAMKGGFYISVIFVCSIILYTFLLVLPNLQ